MTFCVQNAEVVGAIATHIITTAEKTVAQLKEL